MNLHLSEATTAPVVLVFAGIAAVLLARAFLTLVRLRSERSSFTGESALRTAALRGSDYGSPGQPERASRRWFSPLGARFRIRPAPGRLRQAGGCELLHLTADTPVAHREPAQAVVVLGVFSECIHDDDPFADGAVLAADDEGEGGIALPNEVTQPFVYQLDGVPVAEELKMGLRYEVTEPCVYLHDGVELEMRIETVAVAASSAATPELGDQFEERPAPDSPCCDGLCLELDRACGECDAWPDEVTQPCVYLRDATELVEAADAVQVDDEEACELEARQGAPSC